MNDVKYISGSLSGGVMTIKLSRKIVTDDPKWDVPYVNGENALIWSYNLEKNNPVIND